MEIGMKSEQQLALYLFMDIRNEPEKIVLEILQKIIDGGTITTEEKQVLLKYIRDINLRGKIE